MNEFLCSTTTLVSTTLLKCSVPAEGFWHDALPAITGFVGALIGAAASFLAQFIAARSQEKVQQLGFDRRDGGIRRQVSALMKQVTRYVDIAARAGVINLPHFETLLRTVNERIYTWDASMALDDAQARALYDASEAIGIACDSVKAYFDVTAPGARSKERVKLAFTPARGKLIDFWQAIGDEKFLRRIRGNIAIGRYS